MTSAAAVTGFILLLLSVEVVHGFWEVECSKSSFCFFKGSTVEVICSIEYPPGLTDKEERVFWFTKEQNGEPVDLRTDPQYKDRVSVSSGPGRHTLMINNLRESDSVGYYFKVETNFTGGTYSSVTGVIFSVQGPLVQLNRDPSADRSSLICRAWCPPSGQLSYIWYKNGEEIHKERSDIYNLTDSSYGNIFSCAVIGHEDFPSRPLLIQDQDMWMVKCRSSVCGYKGSDVEMECSYRYTHYRHERLSRALTSTWFTTDINGEPVKLGPEYNGRLLGHRVPGHDTLIIRNLRESDSGVYSIRLETNQTVDTTDGRVSLTVTDPDLQAQVRGRLSLEWAHLKCHSRCRLTKRNSFIWYKNGEEIQAETSDSYLLKSFSAADSYSCALHGHKDFPSPLICVSGSSCNRVTYSDRTICAPKGSSLEISCYYNSYENITSKFWFSPGLHHHWQNPSLPEDLSEDSQYADRVQVLETERGRSTLRIRDLRESDSADYRFKFQTQSFEWRSSLPATTVSVTGDLQVQVRGITSNQSSTYADLRCLSSCSPAAPLSYTWIRNGETDSSGAETFIYKGWFSLEEEISCALKGHEQFLSPPVYAPKVPSVVLSPFGEILENSSVTLTCSSDANPEANYTWYKKNGDPDFQPLSAKAELVFSSIQSADSGEYYCEAENHLGKRTSKLFMVDVKYKSTLIINAVRLALMVVILGLVLLLYLWMRTKTAVSSITEPNEPEETVELESHPDDINPSALRGVPAVQTPDTEEQETPV